MYIEDVKTVDDARACAREIIHSAWTHGFTEDLHVNAAARLLDQVAAIKASRARHGGGPGTLELARELGMARSLVAAYNDPELGRDTAAVASTLAARFTVIDHLLARLGIPGAELHPELED